jgi:hypothetical protein
MWSVGRLTGSTHEHGGCCSGRILLPEVCGNTSNRAAPRTLSCTFPKSPVTAVVACVGQHAGHFVQVSVKAGHADWFQHSFAIARIGGSCMHVLRQSGHIRAVCCAVTRCQARPCSARAPSQPSCSSVLLRSSNAPDVSTNAAAQQQQETPAVASTSAPTPAPVPVTPVSTSSSTAAASGNTGLAGGAVAAGVALFLASRLLTGGPSMAALEQQSIPLDVALSNGRPTVVEFYANW